MKKVVKNIELLPPRPTYKPAPDPDWKAIAYQTADILDDLFMFLHPRTEAEALAITPNQREFLAKKLLQFSHLFHKDATTGRLEEKETYFTSQENLNKIWDRIKNTLSSKPATNK